VYDVLEGQPRGRRLRNAAEATGRLMNGGGQAAIKMSGLEVFTALIQRAG
jgi:hypothetical protein